LTEWETVTRTYSWSAKYVSRVTKQIDIKVYDEWDREVEIKDFKIDIEFIIPRMKRKDPTATEFGRKIPRKPFSFPMYCIVL
jgi:hypothetical protein